MDALIDFYNLPIDFYPETQIEVPEKESLFKLFKKYNIDKKSFTRWHKTMNFFKFTEDLYRTREIVNNFLDHKTIRDSNWNWLIELRELSCPRPYLTLSAKYWPG